MGLSAVINTKNAVSSSGHDFRDTLESVSFADELVVVDMHSQDGTEEVASEYTNNIFQFEDVGFVEPARNFALSKASEDWILLVDADEVIGDELQEKITNLISGDATADAYYLPRKNIVFGRWYHHAGWWPDYQLRLFKKGTVSWPSKIHSQAKTTGTTDFLAAKEAHAIIHHNYQTVEQYLDRLNRYTTHEAAQREEKTVTSQSLVAVFDAEIMSRLFLRRGIDAGVHGMGISLLQAFYEVVVDLKQWQLQGFPESTNEKATIKQLRQLQSNLNYWLADWQVRRSSGLTKLIWQLRRKFGV